MPVLFLVGVLLLIGRYDWSLAFPASLRAYVPCLFFFTLFFFFTKIFLEELSLPTKWRVSWLTLLVLTYCFPDHWLGLDKWFIHRRTEILFNFLGDKRFPPAELEFFPKGLKFLGQIPYEWLLVSLIFLSLVVLARYLGTQRSERVFLGVLFILVLFQLWIHLGLRSPYSYMAHFEKDDKNYWYHTALFLNSRGAVNGDYPWFRQAEETLIGFTGPMAPLWDRMFPAFITSAFTRYLYPYHVGIFLNALYWALAVYALYYLGRKMGGEIAGRIAAFLVATSQGFIVYAGQPLPMSYLAAYSSIAILIALYWKFFVMNEPTHRQAFLVGGFMGSLALSYDVQIWWLLFAIMPYLVGTHKRRTFEVIGWSLSIYLIFHNLWRFLPDLTYHSSMAAPQMDPIGDTLKVVFRFDIAEWARLTWATFSGWVTFSLRSFFWWFLVALSCFIFVPLEKKQRNLLILLLVPGFIAYAVMQWSNNAYYLQYPRLVFPSYLGIYLLSALFMAHLWKKNRFYRWGMGGVLGLHFLYVNLDVFGFPYIYMHWFYRGNSLRQIFWHVVE